MEPNATNTDENLVEENDQLEEVEDTKIDYKMLANMTKEMEDQFNMIKSLAFGKMKDKYHLTKEILDAVLPYDIKDIDNVPDEELKSLLRHYQIDDYYTTQSDDIPYKDIVKDIKLTSLELLSFQDQSDQIKRDNSEIVKEYFNYATSQKLDTIRKERLENLRKLIEREPNEANKKKLEKMITALEDTQNFKFLFYRFEKNPKKEADAITKAYFDNHKASYIMERYLNKIKMFGYSKELFKYFFNIEENHLDEQYHPFNNLMLFIYMRMVAYADPYNKTDLMKVQSLTGSFANLVYHKFDSTERENEFKKVITDILDNFMDYQELFRGSNTTWSGHPVRQENDKIREGKRREFILAKLEQMKADPESYNDDMTVDELYDVLEERVNSLKSTQVEAYVKEKEENKKIAEIKQKQEDISESIGVDVNNADGDHIAVTEVGTSGYIAPADEEVQDVESVTTVFPDIEDDENIQNLLKDARASMTEENRVGGDIPPVAAITTGSDDCESEDEEPEGDYRPFPDLSEDEEIQSLLKDAQNAIIEEEKNKEKIRSYHND